MTYAEARDNPQVASRAPVALREAEEALLYAEQTWVELNEQGQITTVPITLGCLQKIFVKKLTPTRSIVDNEYIRDLLNPCTRLNFSSFVVI